MKFKELLGNELNKFLKKKIYDFKFSQRALNFFYSNNINYINDLIQFRAEDILINPQIGRKTLDEIESFLSSYGLYLGMETNIDTDELKKDTKDEIKQSDDNRYVESTKEFPVSSVKKKSHQIDSDEKKKLFDKHKDNPLSLYIKKSHSMSKINNLLGRQLLIKDFLNPEFEEGTIYEKLTSGKKGFGKKTLDLIRRFSQADNLIELVRTRKDLEKILPSDIKDTEIEDLIIQEIEKIKNSLDERMQFIFAAYYGYKCEILTLEQTALDLSKIENKKALTRERIRQYVNKLKTEIGLRGTINKDFLISYLKENQNQGFHKLFPKLDKLFSDTIKKGKTDITGDRLTIFLENYCSLKEDFFETPERTLQTDFYNEGNFNTNQLKEIFEEISSPVDYKVFVEEVMEIFGYKKETAEAAVEFMKNKDLIKIVNQKIYPARMTRVAEVSHILLKFENGLFWKDIFEIMYNSYTQNKISRRDLIMPGAPINLNTKIWMCDKGTYKHIKYLECLANQDEILKNIIDIFKDKKTKVMKIVQILNIAKKNKIEPSCKLNYYEIRTIIRNFGNKVGLFFKGKSGVDSVGIQKNFQYLTGKQNVYNIIKRSEKVISEEEIANMIAERKKSNKIVLVSLWAEQLLKDEKVMRVGPKQWFEKDRALKMCNIDLLLKNLSDLFDHFDFISVNYFTKYINDKMNLAFSYYYYDSIFKIFAKKKNLYYYNAYIGKNDEKIFNRFLYQKYFEKKLSLKQNIEKIKRNKIAVHENQFVNAQYYYK